MFPHAFDRVGRIAKCKVWPFFFCTGNKDRIADAAEADPPRTIGASVAALARALRLPTDGP